MRLPPPIAEAALDALALLIPVSCAGCDRADRALCDGCRDRLVASPVIHRLRADEPTSLPVVAAFAYDGVVRRVIIAFKDGERPGLARALGPALAAAAVMLHHELGGVPDDLTLCALPGTSIARRGYRPVELLARAAGLRLEDLLVAHGGAAQKQLSAIEREGNARARLGLARPVAGRHVVLVDDVVTTGASLRAATDVLEHAGARVLGAVVLAATPARSGHRRSPSGSQDFTR